MLKKYIFQLFFDDQFEHIWLNNSSTIYGDDQKSYWKKETSKPSKHNHHDTQKTWSNQKENGSKLFRAIRLYLKIT